MSDYIDRAVPVLLKALEWGWKPEPGVPSPHEVVRPVAEAVAPLFAEAEERGATEVRQRVEAAITQHAYVSHDPDRRTQVVVASSTIRAALYPDNGTAARLVPDGSTDGD